ncbi:MAG: peptide ABC transporter permease, partial [Myxococcaceae bacterium]
MRRYLLRRLLLAIPTFFGITLLSFALLQLAPGEGGAEGELSGVTQAAREALRHQRGLDRPLLVRYVHWLGDVATLNFGTSSQDSR